MDYGLPRCNQNVPFFQKFQFWFETSYSALCMTLILIFPWSSSRQGGCWEFLNGFLGGGDIHIIKSWQSKAQYINFSIVEAKQSKSYIYYYFHMFLMFLKFSCVFSP